MQMEISLQIILKLYKNLDKSTSAPRKLLRHANKERKMRLIKP